MGCTGWGCHVTFESRVCTCSLCPFCVRMTYCYNTPCILFSDDNPRTSGQHHQPSTDPQQPTRRLLAVHAPRFPGLLIVAAALSTGEMPTANSQIRNKPRLRVVSTRQSQSTLAVGRAAQALNPAVPHHATTRWMMPFPNSARPMTSTKAAITFCSPLPLTGVVPGTDPLGSLSPTKCLPAVRPRPSRPGMTKACRKGVVCVERSRCVGGKGQW